MKFDEKYRTLSKSRFALTLTLVIVISCADFLTVVQGGSSSAGSQQLTINGKLNVTITESITKGTPQIVNFTFPKSEISPTENLRVDTAVLSPNGTQWNDELCPVVFTLRQSRSGRSWALPMIQSSAAGNSKSYSGGFTICLEENNAAAEQSDQNEENNYEFLIFVTTCSSWNVIYTLEMSNPNSGFLLTLEDAVEDIKVTPTSLHFYRFNFPPHVDEVMVQVNSNDTVCMTAAVQSPWCRLLNENSLSYRDKEGTLSKFNAFWQDMNSLAVIPVTKADFMDGFFIGFMVHSDDARCSSYQGVSPDSWSPIESIDEDHIRTKTITISVRPDLALQNLTMPLLFPLLSTLCIIVITTIVFCVFHCTTSRLLGDACGGNFEDTRNLLDNDVLASSMENGDYLNHRTMNNSAGTGSACNSSHHAPSKPATSHDFDSDAPTSCPFLAANSNNNYAAFTTEKQPGNSKSGHQSAGSRHYNGTAAKEAPASADAKAGPSRCPYSSKSGVVKPAADEPTQDPNKETKSTSSSSPDADSIDTDSDAGETFSSPPPRPGESGDDFNTNNFFYRSARHTVRFDDTTTEIIQPEVVADGEGIDEELSASREESTESTGSDWLRMDALVRKRNLKKTLDKLYMLIGTVGIFYGLPTIQLLYTYHKITQSTGQTDLCYRNYLCSHKFLSFDDFNHIYSNLIYILLAVVFFIFVSVYDHKVKKIERKRQEENVENDIGQGVVHEFGVFYALGLALAFEGILSGMYHVCPTEMNFQFDTSFMFIIAAVCTIKVYQFRHPNPICPHNTFGLLALISFISVGGIILGSKAYEIVFIILHLILMMFLSVYLYYVGYIRDEDSKVVTDSSIFQKSGLLKTLRTNPLTVFQSKHPTRLILIVPLVAFNVGINMSQLLGNDSFPTYIVYLFVGNMLLYFVYYFVMKIVHGEICNVQSIQPIIYLIFSISMGTVGALYFKHKEYNANISPAESRALNAPCTVLNFYDTHDLWHFFSAGAIFFFFMTLLTLDDGIVKRPRKKIVVF